MVGKFTCLCSLRQKEQLFAKTAKIYQSNLRVFAHFKVE
jgi:hypothetical protein